MARNHAGPISQGDTTAGQRTDEADGDADGHQVVGARERDATDLEPVVGGDADDLGWRGQPEAAASPAGRRARWRAHRPAPDEQHDPEQGGVLREERGRRARCRPRGRPTCRQHRFGRRAGAASSRDAGPAVSRPASRRWSRGRPRRPTAPDLEERVLVDQRQRGALVGETVARSTRTAGSACARSTSGQGRTRVAAAAVHGVGRVAQLEHPVVVRGGVEPGPADRPPGDVVADDAGDPRDVAGTTAVCRDRIRQTSAQSARRASR